MSSDTSCGTQISGQIYTLSNRIQQDSSRHNLVLSLLWPVWIHCHRTAIVSLCIVTRKIRSLKSHYIMINFSKKKSHSATVNVRFHWWNLWGRWTVGKPEGRMALPHLPLGCWCTEQDQGHSRCSTNTKGIWWSHSYRLEGKEIGRRLGSRACPKPSGTEAKYTP